jgi:hypothetical protein
MAAAVVLRMAAGGVLRTEEVGVLPAAALLAAVLLVAVRLAVVLRTEEEVVDILLPPNVRPPHRPGRLAIPKVPLR